METEHNHQMEELSSKQEDKNDLHREMWFNFLNEFLSIRTQAVKDPSAPEWSLDPKYVLQKTKKQIEMITRKSAQQEGYEKTLESVYRRHNPSLPDEPDKWIREGSQTGNSVEDVPVDTLELARLLGINLTRPQILIVKGSREIDEFLADDNKLDDKERYHVTQSYYLAASDKGPWLEFTFRQGPIDFEPQRKYTHYKTICYVHPERIDWLKWEKRVLARDY